MCKLQWKQIQKPSRENQCQNTLAPNQNKQIHSTITITIPNQNPKTPKPQTPNPKHKKQPSLTMSAYPGHLSQGSIVAINNNNADSSTVKPFLQILDVKKIPNTNTNQADRYRLVISDGLHYQQAMLATQLNSLIDRSILKQYCIVHLTEFICNFVAGRRIVIVLNMQVVDAGPGGIMNNPVTVEQAKVVWWCDGVVV